MTRAWLKTLLLAMAMAMAMALALFAPAFAQQGKVQVQWLGQAAFKLTSPGGKVIVIDPWLATNPKTPEAFKNLEALGKVDLILVSHGHFDHVADVVPLAKLSNAPVWGPAGLTQSMQVLGLLPVQQLGRMNKSGSIKPIGPDIKVTLVHAEHSSELVYKNTATGKDELHVGGEPGGFIIEFENGFKLWHMGDTGVFGDMKLIGELYKPDLVLMPIGGGQFVMNPADAAFAARDLIKAKTLIPMHYGTNASLPGTPAELLKALGANSGVKVLEMQPGDKLEF